MNIGDYVRTKYGIGKIIETRIFLEKEEIKLDSNTGKIIQVSDNSHWNYKEDIIKSSPNIIDLIEVGDFVNYEQINGGYVLNKKEDSIDTWAILPNSLKNEDIKSVITREQMKSLEYKIGE